MPDDGLTWCAAVRLGGPHVHGLDQQCEWGELLMADTYVVSSSDLASVADAIRTKTGDSSKLTFPSGFTSAIGSIQNAPAVYVEENLNEDGKFISAVVHGRTVIRGNLFNGCTNLVTVTIPDNITLIYESAFYFCIELTTVNLPDTIVTIASGAFQQAVSFNTPNLPNSLMLIGSRAFSQCESLTLTSLPPNLSRIATEAFSDCTKLAITVIPESVDMIDGKAFCNCTSLTTLTFQGTPTTIAADSFEGCSNLTTINVPWAEGVVANAPWGATNATISYNYTG